MIKLVTVGIDENELIWDRSYNVIHQAYYENRKALSRKLQNLNFMKITFKTYRHWKATTEYHKTKDILYVKELLGHKRIENTFVHTHLVEFDEDDSFIVKLAESLVEFTELLEKGFEYIGDYEDKKVLRKRK